MTKIIILLLILNLGLQVQAASNTPPMTAQQGLEKIKTNLENAKKNKLEYDKNLEKVIANVGEVQKAKEATLIQKKTLDYELVKNSESLKKLSSQEKDLTGLSAKEKEKLASEDKQIDQLQKMITQIKNNQEQRHQILQNYDNQLAALNNNRKSWKDRETNLKTQQGKTTQALRSIASEESTWVSKKKKYEGEVKRWALESEKQQKIHDTYQGLAEGK
jgi:chromosome segregation ATPase